MQARKRISLLVLPVAMALVSFSVVAADDPSQAPAAAPEPAAATSAAGPAGPAVPVSPAASPSGLASGVAPSSAQPSVSGAPEAAAPVGQADGQDGFGVAMSSDQLNDRRGGDALVGQNYLTGTVASDTATKVETGSNAITAGSFANSAGLPTVIQNTGANVLIQNATVLNVRFGN